MNYKLIARGASSLHLSDIGEEEFDRFAEARKGILEALIIEEKFDLLMENYFEFEDEILSTSLRYIIFSDDILEMPHQARLAIARRLANLMTTCRLYIDQSTHHLRRLFGPNSSYERLHRGAMSSQYDKHLSYRILEELRNYSQHRGYPFHIITFSYSLVEPEPGADTVTVVKPRLSIPDLEEDGGFNSRVLAEIQQEFDQAFDLRPHVRRYISCLRTVQSELRRSLEEKLTEWIDGISEAVSVTGDAIQGDEAVQSIELVAEGEAGEEERLFFSVRSIDRLEIFARKNQDRGSLTSRFVSGQADSPSA